jgi:thiol-disulfide isomerase/thioredoxin
MLETDQTIRDFRVVSLSGEVVNVQADPARPTLMYFFAPWCSVCRASIGNLDDLDPDKVQLYVIALDYKNQNEVEQFVSNVGLESPVYLGTNEIRDGFAVKAYPSYYVLDERFSITSRTVGYSTSLGMWLRTL